MRRGRVDFEQARVVEDPKEWAEQAVEGLVSTGVRLRVARSQNHLANVDWGMFNLNDHLFTHCTIVAGIPHDARDNHTITPGCVPYVNSNNNAWLMEVLGPPTNVYKSFMGAENYYEHCQVPQLSKGKILDAVLRQSKNEAGEKILLTDILVATHRAHRDLVERIRKGNLKTLSMGCVASVTQCSRCGKVIRTDSENCDHLLNESGRPYKTPYGYESKTTELCGVKGEPHSCRFVEASWVESPAYKGAVVNHYVNLPPVAERLASCDIIELGGNVIDLTNPSDDDLTMLRYLRVADRAGMTAVRLLVERTDKLLHDRRLARLASDLTGDRT